jgi:hypothetical protein
VVPGLAVPALILLLTIAVPFIGEDWLIGATGGGPLHCLTAAMPMAANRVLAMGSMETGLTPPQGSSFLQRPWSTQSARSGVDCSPKLKAVGRRLRTQCLLRM